MNARRASSMCLPAQISEGLSKTIVEQACNLIDVEKHNAGHFETAKGESRRHPADKCSFSVVAPETLRTLLADPPAATHRLNPSSSGTGREEDHSVCLNLKSRWGRSTNPSIPRSGFLQRRLSQAQ
jgi:hypothetical protein